MNDYSESQYFSDQLAIWLKNNRSEIRRAFYSRFYLILSEDDVDQILNTIEALIDNYRVFHGYVFCLSQRGNLLSLWRGYANSKGISIGFNYQKLIDLLEGRGITEDISLIPCSYNFGQSKIRFKGSLLHMFSYCYRGLEASSKRAIPIEIFPEKATPNIIRCLNEISLEYKHPGFKEEKEWRLIADNFKWIKVGQKLEKRQILFRPGATTLIPYIELNFENILDLIDEVFVGPSVDFELVKRSILLLLNRTDIRIIDSGIPFRAQI